MSSLILSLAAALAAAGGIDHEKVAKDFLATHGLRDMAPAEVRIDELLAKHYLTGRAGIFEVYFPVAGLESRASDLKDCLAALVEAQEQLLEWSKPSGRDQKAVRADLKAVAGWLKTVRPQALAKAKDAAGKDLTAILGAPEAVSAASERLAASFGRGEALGLSRDPPGKVRLMLAPTRREFAELVCFVGWWSEEWRASYWVDSISDWSTTWMDDIQVIALEYAAPGHLPEDYSSGEALNKRDPKVMEQQVVQLSVLRAFEQLFGERVPAAFSTGLAMNLVIDQFGEINTRVDGDLRGRTANRREVFVPGGASGGGFLPKNSAETRWREDRGKDRFLRVLRLAQKEGTGAEKDAKNKVAGFALRSDKGGEMHVAKAPFLGAAAAEGQAPPEAFQGDFEEMLRGYKCAFIYWLQSKAGGPDKASREKFAQLIEKLADPALEFEATFQAVYEGAALSDADAGKDSLEGKFLLWLAKQ
ncbi:MAG: hypothetical protein ACKVXR_09695 [Planctomycetota bacterium]